MNTSLSPEAVHSAVHELKKANETFDRFYPGESDERQPVHTVYGGAHLFNADTAAKLGQSAVGVMQSYAPNAIEFARALGLPGSEKFPSTAQAQQRLVKKQGSRKGTAAVAHTIYSRVLEKLEREAVEDFRIDFEDGYGNRPDAEEDADAVRTAIEVAKAMAAGSLPPFSGIRIKPLTNELMARSIRTMDIFITKLVESAGQLPDHFVITLPKVTLPEQVSTLVGLLKNLESRLQMAPQSLKFEIMVETTQSIIDREGRSMLPRIVASAEGRCMGAHFGVYDYTAASQITAEFQSMDHPVCDFARHMMKVAFNGTGIRLSDGATNVLPVGPHKGKGRSLTAKQKKENLESVHAAWKLNFNHVSHSLRHGYYQGWDLHPAQLPVRYAAVYYFFLRSLDAATVRLRNFMNKAAQATLVGDVFDDAATGQGLLNYFLRGLNCGAITAEEVRATGLTLDEIRLRSFVKIIQTRRKNQT